jgi:gamma-glutamyltranspeptidase/glutathione hydrolase/leukotriene-C4 hydrolase
MFINETWARITDNQTQELSYYNPRFSPSNDAGTSHMTVLAPNGDAVSVTTLVLACATLPYYHNDPSPCSTVNFFFGSKLMTDTGIVLNNEMDDFSAPNISANPSNLNFVRPGKRPLSSTTPTLAVRVSFNSSFDFNPSPTLSL